MPIKTQGPTTPGPTTTTRTTTGTSIPATRTPGAPTTPSGTRSTTPQARPPTTTTTSQGVVGQTAKSARTESQFQMPKVGGDAPQTQKGPEVQTSQGNQGQALTSTPQTTKPAQTPQPPTQNGTGTPTTNTNTPPANNPPQPAGTQDKGTQAGTQTATGNTTPTPAKADAPPAPAGAPQGNTQGGSQQGGQSQGQSNPPAQSGPEVQTSQGNQGQPLTQGGGRDTGGTTPQAGRDTGAQPGYTQPGGGNTGAQPGYTQPGGGNTGAQPGYTQPGGGNTGAQPGYTQPGGRDNGPQLGYATQAGADVPRGGRDTTANQAPGFSNQTGPEVQTSQGNQGQPLLGRDTGATGRDTAPQPGYGNQTGYGSQPGADVPRGGRDTTANQAPGFSNQTGPEVQTSQGNQGQPLLGRDTGATARDTAPQPGYGNQTGYGSQPGADFPRSTRDTTNPLPPGLAKQNGPEVQTSRGDTGQPLVQNPRDTLNNPTNFTQPGADLPRNTRDTTNPLPPGLANQNGPEVQTSQGNQGQPLIQNPRDFVPPGQQGRQFPGQNPDANAFRQNQGAGANGTQSQLTQPNSTGAFVPGQTPNNTPTTPKPPTPQPSQANIGTPLSEIPLAQNPVQDGYRPQFRANAEATVQGRPVETPVHALVPPLDETKTLQDVQEHFAKDFPLLKGQVVDLPHLTSPEKAERAFEFFAEYAQRFVQLATGEQQAKQDAQNGKKTPEGAEVPQDPHAPKDPATGRPVTDAAGANAHLEHGEEGEAALAEGELPENAAAKQNAEAKKGEKKSRLERMLAGELPDETPKAKKEGRLDKLAELARALEADPRILQDSPSGKGAAAHAEKQQEQADAFAKLLESHDFEHLYDARTGKDGVELARELLNARSLKEFEQLSEQRKVTAEDFPPRQQENEPVLPPEQYHPATLGKEPTKQLKDLGESGPLKDARRQEAERPVLLQDRPARTQQAWDGPRILIPVDREPSRFERLRGVTENLPDTFGRMGRKLGSNHLWNVLHQFRAFGADSAVEKEKFDQLAFAAILMLSLLAGGVIVLASL